MKASEIINDQSIRPYFFDLICKNFVLGLTDLHRVNYSERMRYQKEYYESLVKLSDQLSGKVNDAEISKLIKEVSLYYLSTIGKIGFSVDGYDSSLN